MTKAVGVRVLSQFKNCRERGVDVSRARLESRFIGGGGHLVPGTDVLANITAVQPAFQMSCYLRTKLGRAGFDRRVRDTQIGIDDIRLDYRAGGAGVNTERARAALVRGFLVRIF